MGTSRIVTLLLSVLLVAHHLHSTCECSKIKLISDVALSACRKENGWKRPIGILLDTDESKKEEKLPLLKRVHGLASRAICSGGAVASLSFADEDGDLIEVRRVQDLAGLQRRGAAEWPTLFVSCKGGGGDGRTAHGEEPGLWSWDACKGEGVRAEQFDRSCLSAYYVNLDSRQDRRVAFERRLRAHKVLHLASDEGHTPHTNSIPVHRVRAVDGKTVDLEALVAMGKLAKETIGPGGVLSDAGETLEVKGKVLTRGGVGCALSHIAIWENIRATGCPGLILEDDTEILPSFSERFGPVLDQLPHNFGALYLGHDDLQVTIPHKWRVPNITRILGLNYGTYGYLLSVKGAESRSFECITLDERGRRVSTNSPQTHFQSSIALLQDVYPITEQIDSYILRKVVAGLNSKSGGLNSSHFSAFRTEPALVWTEKGEDRDTDIQRYVD